MRAYICGYILFKIIFCECEVSSDIDVAARFRILDKKHQHGCLINRLDWVLPRKSVNLDSMLQITILVQKITNPRSYELDSTENIAAKNHRDHWMPCEIGLCFRKNILSSVTLKCQCLQRNIKARGDENFRWCKSEMRGKLEVIF